MHFDPATYQGYNSDRVSLVWRGNILASASANDGLIKLLDSKRAGAEILISPRHVMKHLGVQAIEFCPVQPNLLVSGGIGGLRFWNAWNGELRGMIETPRPVKGLLCHSTKHEVLVASGRTLSLWTMELRRSRVIEQSTGEGDILCLVRGHMPGSIVSLKDNETLAIHHFLSPVSKKTTRCTSGIVEMPIVR